MKKHLNDLTVYGYNLLDGAEVLTIVLIQLICMQSRYTFNLYQKCISNKNNVIEMNFIYTQTAINGNIGSGIRFLT